MRDLPILAEYTSEVAPEAAEGKAPRAGKVMIDRLLLDRIGGHGRDDAVDSRVYVPALVHSGEADAHLALGDVTSSLADVALRPVVRQLIVQYRLVELNLFADRHIEDPSCD